MVRMRCCIIRSLIKDKPEKFFRLWIWKGWDIIMEIERKFLMDRFPEGMVPVDTFEMRQGYLCNSPTIRIRSRLHHDGKSDYRLCFKGKGTLARQETEIEISAETFSELSRLLPIPPVIKEHRVYAIDGNYMLECNRVEPGSDTEFYYAEVEFDTVEAAREFVPPAFLGREVTETPGYSMGSYWKRKLALLKK